MLDISATTQTKRCSPHLLHASEPPTLRHHAAWADLNGVALGVHPKCQAGVRFKERADCFWLVHVPGQFRLHKAHADAVEQEGVLSKRGTALVCAVKQDVPLIMETGKAENFPNFFVRAARANLQPTLHCLLLWAVQ